MNDEELKEFQEWKRLKKQSELDKTFSELEDLLNNPDARSYNATMPVRAFRIMAKALILLKQEVIK